LYACRDLCAKIAGSDYSFIFIRKEDFSPVDNGAGGEFLPPDAQEAGA